MSNGFTPPPDFWPHFVEHYLDKRPGVFRRFYAAPVTTPGEVFEGLAGAGEQFRAGVARGALRFHVEHSPRYEAPAEKQFPTPADNSLDGYAERIGRDLGGRKFYLAFDGYQAHDARVYLRVREFLRGLYEIRGTPASSATAVVLFGNYGKTPFGLHRDDAGNFTFVLAGRKRILAWPDEYFSGREGVRGSLDCEPFRADAVVLEGEPGDLLYWPPNYWHIADSPGGLPLTLSVGNFYSPADSAARAFQGVARLVERRVGAALSAGLYPLDPNKLPESAGRLPLVAAQLNEALLDAGRDERIAQALRVAWLNRVSGFGFGAVPPPLARQALADDDVCRVDPRYPVIWLPSGGEITCSANGHAFTVTAHPNILKLLEHLNGGEPCRVGCLTERYAGAAPLDGVEVTARPADLRALLEKLWSLRALTRAARPDEGDGPRAERAGPPP